MGSLYRENSHKIYQGALTLWKSTEPVVDAFVCLSIHPFPRAQPHLPGESSSLELSKGGSKLLLTIPSNRDFQFCQSTPLSPPDVPQQIRKETNTNGEGLREKQLKRNWPGKQVWEMKTIQEIYPERQAQKEIQGQCEGEQGEGTEIKLSQH